MYDESMTQEITISARIKKAQSSVCILRRVTAWRSFNMLGRSLLRSLARDVTGGIVGGLAFGAGSALIDNLLGGSQPAPAGNYIPQSVPNPSSSGTTVANIALARIALCYYIAKADGVISPEEQMDLDYMCSSLMNNPNASSTFRKELQQTVTDRSSNFMTVEKYLNRLDANTLSTLQADAQRIAELTDGVTENEKRCRYSRTTSMESRDSRAAI